MNSKVTGSGAAADDEDDDVKKKTLQFSAIIMTFGPRDENKSCSECPEDQHKQLTYDM